MERDSGTFSDSREHDEAADGGENLTFDFGDDEPAEMEMREEPHAEPPEEWEVGEPGTGTLRREEGPNAIAEESPHEIPPRPGHVEGPPKFEPPAQPQFGRPEAEPEPIFVEAVRVRSSFFFLGVFVALFAAFALLSLAIVSAPEASRRLFDLVPGLGERFKPAPNPANEVVLSDIHADYQVLKEGPAALLVSGRARNDGTLPLHRVRLRISLIDSGEHELAAQTISCGNVISNRMISEMTEREIEFFQRLDPPKTFVMKTGDSASFVVVFLNPSAHPAHFRVKVVAADPPAESVPAT